MDNMKPVTTLAKYLGKLQEIRRRSYHPLVHKVHRRYGISKKTLFYVKEYGPRANVPKTIIKESIKLLLLTSIISSLGGLALEHVKMLLVSVMPLLILLPTLNDMIGDFGTITAACVSTMLHEGKLRGRVFTEEVKKLFVQILLVALLISFASAVVALSISLARGFELSPAFALKILLVVLLDVIILVSVLFFTAIRAGIHFYKRREDPNNLLIPITTSLADFSNMFLLAILLLLFF